MECSAAGRDLVYYSFGDVHLRDVGLLKCKTAGDYHCNKIKKLKNQSAIFASLIFSVMINCTHLSNNVNLRINFSLL